MWADNTSGMGCFIQWRSQGFVPCCSRNFQGTSWSLLYTSCVLTPQPISAKDYFLFLSHYLCPPNLQMQEDDLLHIQHIGDVIDILQTTTHHLYDPDELLTVNLLHCYFVVLSFPDIFIIFEKIPSMPLKFIPIAIEKYSFSWVPLVLFFSSPLCHLGGRRPHLSAYSPLTNVHPWKWKHGLVKEVQRA